MKAVLEFDLEDFHDREAHLRCMKSIDLALVISDIQSRLRKDIEWEIEKSKNEIEPGEVLNKTLEKIGEYLHTRGIIIDDLIS